MKILLAPSETKTLYKDTNFDIDSLLFTNALPQRKDILKKYNEIIKDNNPEEIKEMFGLKKDNDIAQYLKTIDNQSPACKAIKLYTGVAFDYLEYDSLVKKEQKYIEENVIIFSNLFGPVLAGDVLPLKVIVPLISYKEIHQDKSWLVVITPNELNGLSKLSTADTLNIRSVSDERMVKKIGAVDETTYQALVDAMKVVLDIN